MVSKLLNNLKKKYPKIEVIEEADRFIVDGIEITEDVKLNRNLYISSGLLDIIRECAAVAGVSLNAYIVNRLELMYMEELKARKDTRNNNIISILEKYDETDNNTYIMLKERSK